MRPRLSSYCVRLRGLSSYEFIKGPGKPGEREPNSSRALVDEIACRQLLLGARVKRPQPLEKVTRGDV